MTLSGIVGDLQRSGIKLSHELNHLVDNFFSKQTLLVQDTLPETNSKFAPEKMAKPKRKGSSSNRNHPFSGALVVSFRQDICPKMVKYFVCCDGSKILGSATIMGIPQGPKILP